MNDYQREEIAKLSFKIDQIVDQEENFNEIIRKESLRDEEDVKFNVITEFGARNRKINEIGEKQNEIRRKEVRYMYEINKKLTRYKIKVGILWIIVILVGLVCLYLLFTDRIPTTEPLQPVDLF